MPKPYIMKLICLSDPADHLLANITLLDFSIPDPPLTERGLGQCKVLEHQLQNSPIIKETRLIVLSPMRRTLQTAQASLGWLLEQGVPSLVNPDWTETTTHACDIGSSVDELTLDFPQFKFDTIYPEWPSKSGRYAHTPAAVEARGLDCRRWLRARPENVIIAVSHADFLYRGIAATVFGNANARVFDFAENSDTLVERVGARGGFTQTRRASF